MRKKKKRDNIKMRKKEERERETKSERKRKKEREEDKSRLNNTIVNIVKHAQTVPAEQWVQWKVVKKQVSLKEQT